MSRIKAAVTVELEVSLDFTDEDLKGALMHLGITKRAKEWRERALLELVEQRVSAMFRGEYAAKPGQQTPENHGIQIQSMCSEKVHES